MQILLPPSEGKATPRRGAPLNLDALSSEVLSSPREAVLAALVDLCTSQPGDAVSILGLSPGLADEVAKNARVLTSPAVKAEHLYTGVLYDALDLPGLTGTARRRGNQWVRVTSSLFGLVGPSDRIPAYRLAGNVKLPGIGVVSTFWGQHLDAVIDDPLVVDLRSGTYLPFWRPSPAFRGDVVTLRVLHEHNGARKVVSHFNKATKGRLVRSLLIDGDAVRSARRFVELLGDLGWQIEAGDKPGSYDVVVAEL